MKKTIGNLFVKTLSPNAINILLYIALIALIVFLIKYF